MREALGISNPHASEDKVHELLARHLDEITPNARMSKTGYFNHSWAPDLVIGSTEQKGEERAVYLRFDVKHPAFADDLKYLAPKEPFFLDLAAANPGEGIVDETAVEFDLSATLTKYREVLVSEVPAVELMERGVKEDRGAREATGRVVQGGQGLVDPPAAERIIGSWKEASSAVQEKSPGELRSAIDQIEEFLNEDSAIDFESSLRQRWMAAGGAAETFPGKEQWSVQGRKPREIARLVVALVDEGDEVPQERWEEIASATSLSDLGHELAKLAQHRHGGGVNDLVRAGLRYWTAAFVYAPPLESDTMDRFDWSFGKYSIALNLIRCQAYFTDIGNKWSRVPRPKALPYVKEALDVLGDANVLGVGLLTTEEDMSVTLRPSATKSLRERVEQYIGEQPDAAWKARGLQKSICRCPEPARLPKSTTTGP